MCIRDSSYYVLGYYSANPAADGKYRHVTVKIASLPESAKLDYRKGYYAAKVWGKMNSSDKERQLEDALTLDDPFTELPLALEVDYFQTGRDKYFVPITVRIAGSALGLSPKSTTDLDFIGQIRDPHGKMLGGIRDEIKLKLTEENAAQLAQRHVEYDTGVTLPPGDYNPVSYTHLGYSGSVHSEGRRAGCRNPLPGLSGSESAGDDQGRERSYSGRHGHYLGGCAGERS